MAITAIAISGIAKSVWLLLVMCVVSPLKTYRYQILVYYS